MYALILSSSLILCKSFFTNICSCDKIKFVRIYFIIINPGEMIP